MSRCPRAGREVPPVERYVELPTPSYLSAKERTFALTRNGKTMQPIRIAAILPGLGRVERGAETAFLEIAKHLNSYADLDVQLFGSGHDVPSGLPIEVIESTRREQFERLPKLPLFRTECHYEEFFWVRALRRSGKFDPTQFDVTLSCTYPWINWYLQRAKQRNPALVNLFTMQNGDWMCQSQSSEYRYFAADGLAAINPDYFERNSTYEQRRLIPNGTDPEIFFPRAELSDHLSAPLQIEPAIETDRPIVLMVSALIDSKRVIEGVRSAARVENAYLLIAGDGPERERISQEANKLMPGRYRLLGSVPREQMPALFRSADAFLHMSKTEPFGIVYLEAAASGLPIVTHDADTPRWILGDNAIFVNSDDPDAVADGLSRALQPDTGKSLGAAARARTIAEWTWKAQAGRYRDFIHDLLPRTTSTQGNEDAIDHHRQLQHQ